MLVLSSAVALAGCRASVHSGLSERSANEIVVVLRGEGVLASKAAAAGGWAVEVPKSQADRALELIVAAGLPRRETQYAALLAESGGLVPSAENERARRAALIEAGLEETLLALDGVYEAFVHAVVPAPPAGFGATRDAPEAPRVAIVVVEQGAGAPPDEAIAAIAVGAVEGLSPERVAIVRSRVALPSPSSLELVPLGPFVVAAESAAGLRRTLVVMAGLVGLLGVGLAASVLWRRRG